ncbi:hypothetical protein SDRG_15935 [Saprolegnia diclina VS20]|uniref:Uncharacterized protein n=1 Tax=Saprolegnia diclina (strain VS20) TaxID=1156394 RepID=T0R2E3_SAPDV|nr:hypothetical protein SDRG_15935 [Saprolegnia diclina VS20]EQC26198.1 hypothetical protein SDRG_15935 [Saprolegnia diclina VS20]|eukprot:XP_008620343.1 hypothetical protein SDRG_15935 [Saprolegnia diclina VS20]
MSELPPLAPKPRVNFQSFRPETYGTVAPLSELSGHSNYTYALGWNAAGSLLASGSTDKSLRIWDPETNMLVTDCIGHGDSVNQLTWDPTSNTRVASTSGDKTVRIWDTKSSKATANLPFSSEIMNLAYSQDGKYIAAGHNDTTIYLIDTRKNKMVRRIVNLFDVNELQFSKSGFLFVAAGHPSGYGTFEVMKIAQDDKAVPPTLENVTKVIAHSGSCFAMDLDPTGRRLALGGADSLVSIWDLEEVYCEHTFIGSQSLIRTVSFSHDGMFLASGSEDPCIPILHVPTGELAFSIGMTDSPQQIAWHPAKPVLAYVGDKGALEKNKDRLGAIKLVSLKAP